MTFIVTDSETCEGCLFWCDQGDGFCSNENNDPTKNKGKYKRRRRWDRCGYLRPNLRSRNVQALEAIVTELRKHSA